MSSEEADQVEWYRRIGSRSEDRSPFTVNLEFLRNKTYKTEDHIY